MLSSGASSRDKPIEIYPRRRLRRAGEAQFHSSKNAKILQNFSAKMPHTAQCYYTTWNWL